MALDTISKLIMNNGFAVVLLGYFIVKDWTQTKEMIKTMTRIDKVLSVLSTKLEIDEKE